MGKKDKKKTSSNEALETRQTSDIGWFSTQFQEHPVRGLTPQKLHQLLTNAESGDLSAQADLFCDMVERDAHLYSEYSKRKRAVTCLNWGVRTRRNATPEDEKIAANLADYFDDFEGFEQVLHSALDAIGHGYSAQEITWENQDGIWLPKSFEFKLPRMFTTTADNPNELKLATTGGAETLWAFGWFVHKAQANNGYLARTGLHRILAWPFLFKNYSVKDLMEFLEIYGLPMRIGKYAVGATEEEKTTLLRAVMTLGRNAGGIVPQGMDITFEEAAKGTADPHMAMIKWCELSQSKAILGSTLTSQADGKSSTNALGKIHNEVRWELTESDALQLARSINDSIITYIMQINYPDIPPHRYPQFYFDLTQNEDLLVYAEALPKLVDINLEIPIDWVHQKLGIPKPENEKTKILKRSPAVNLAANSYQPFMQFAGSSVVKDQPQLPLEEQALLSLLNEQSEQSQEVAEKWLSGLMANLLKGETPEEALELLANAYPNEDEPALQERLSKLIFAAEIFGRLSIDAEDS
ncbi:hypothetical protein F892_03105 [Acinetobacter vivianii]|uniref:DUF935 domain-containing protein n=1 Tax=Acinetobacter vivianii TaxID=1776742 RepID=N9PZI3_9GAMM|nr:DUF935 domain-containing protein [Acinetobacter vivianii]ENX20182.1 hypothetical protein F892_03105 [Acinetobacter vivianii]GGI59370.1 hypothetical protein GCM10011446_08650 [Acinetobacter vivianii]